MTSSSYKTIVMAHAQNKSKMNEGFGYYLITGMIGWFFSLLQLNIYQEGLFSIKSFIGGLITASGALFFNRLLVPWFKRFRSNRKKKKHGQDNQQPNR
jgi:heme/copper-type cytochrome/quinol oxidase subunit 3